MKTLKDSYNTTACSEIQNQLFRATDIMRSQIPRDEYHIILFLLILKRDGFIGEIFAEIELNRDSQRNNLLRVFEDRLRKKEGWWTSIYKVYEPIVSKFNVNDFWVLLDTLNSIEQPTLLSHFTKIFDELLYRLSNLQGRYSGEYIQPQELGRLASQLVELPENASIYNPFAGLASFGVFPKLFGQYYGQEINLTTWTVGTLRLIAHSKEDKSSFLLGDSIRNWNPSGEKYDLVISNPPFSLRLPSDFKDQFPEFRTIEQYFLKRGIDDLKYNGKLVGVFSQGFLFRLGPEERLRKFIVENDLLDTVISFPRGILVNTSIPITIIVIDKDKKSKGFVRFVDAKNYVVSSSSRGKAIDADELLTLLKGNIESENVSVVSKQKIRDFGYNLDINRYFAPITEYDKSIKKVRLGEMTQIIRGQRIQGLISGKFIRIRDLKDDRLQYQLDLELVKSIEVPKAAKKISETCLLIAVRWKTLKPTYFRYEGEPIYIIPDTIALKIDESKIDIEYLINELHSDVFTNTISSYRIGAIIPYIRVEDLLKVGVPLPSIEEQRAKVLGIKETLAKEKDKEVELFRRINGLETDITEQNTHLRHSLAGPSSNLKGAFTNLREILLNKVQPVVPDIMDLKVSEDHDLTLGRYLEIIERDIIKITNAVSRRLKVDTSIESKKLEKLEIVSFVENYVREYTEKKDLIFEIKFELDEEAFLDTEGEFKKTYIMGNSELLTDLLNNLIDNAVAHAFHPKWKNRIELYLMRDSEIDKPNEVQILFSNTGKPFPENIKYSDFIKKGTKAGLNAGDGFGGWYINEIIKKHNGTFDIIDETGIEGLTNTDLATSFEINFPIYENGD